MPRQDVINETEDRLALASTGIVGPDDILHGGYRSRRARRSRTVLLALFLIRRGV